MQLYTHNGTAGRRRKPFPPHGPHLVCALTEGSYVVPCLACRLVGPERKTCCHPQIFSLSLYSSRPL